MDIRKVKGMSAAQFMATLHTAGREDRTLYQPKADEPKVASVDRWIDGLWVKKFYQHDGSTYSIDVSDQYRQDGSRIW